MKVIIAGSRTITGLRHVEDAISAAKFLITEVVSGGARGVDRLGEEYATMADIPCKIFPAEWDRYGKSAGYKRNEVMASYADAAIIVWDGVSKGAKHMADYALKQGLKVYIHKVEGDNCEPEM